MISGYKFVEKDDVIIEYFCDGVFKTVKLSDIEPFWSYAIKDEYEAGYIGIQANYLFFSLTTAGGQGGIVVAWDPEKETVVHISAASYCLTFCVYEDNVFIIRMVNNAATPTYYYISAIPLFTIDAWDEGCDLYTKNRFRIDENGTVGLTVNHNGIFVQNNGKNYQYSNTTDINELSKDNEESKAILKEIDMLRKEVLSSLDVPQEIYDRLEHVRGLIL